MSIDEEKLMAFADGALTGPEAEAVARAVADDPTLAEKLAQHRQIRQMLAEAFDPILAEPVPSSIHDTVTGRTNAPSADMAAPNVADLASTREWRRGYPDRRRKRGFVQRWGSLAAALAVGVVAGQIIGLDRGMVREHHGRLVARSELASALNNQIAADDPATRGSPVRIGITFRNQHNQYCRTFSAARADSISGIACRDNGHWEIPMTAAGSPSQGSEGYRMAGSDDAIMQAAQAMMKGQPFDAAAEARGRAGGWQN